MTISIEKLRAVKHVVAHGPSCPDGIASALIIADAIPGVRVSFMQYDSEEHRRLIPEPGTLFVDFSPYVPKEAPGVLNRWIEMGAITLDHHPTQRDLTMRFVEAGLGIYGENDRNECGAWLAYEHVWEPLKTNEFISEPTLQKGASVESAHEYAKQVRAFASLAAIRDTWKKDDPRWQKACEQAEALMFWGFDECKAINLHELQDVRLNVLGRHLFEKKLQSARKAIGESHRFATNKGTRVLMFQGVTPTSDAAEILEKAGPGWTSQGVEVKPTDIVAGFHYRVDAGRLKLQFSTRSHTGYDVGAFCKSKGGGGHRAAAGFTVEQNAELGANPYQVFRGILEEWELGQ